MKVDPENHSQDGARGANARMVVHLQTVKILTS